MLFLSSSFLIDSKLEYEYCGIISNNDENAIVSCKVKIRLISAGNLIIRGKKELLAKDLPVG